MISSSEIIDLIKRFSLSERLLIAEEIIKDIREENKVREIEEQSEDISEGPAILEFAGIMNEEEAQIFTDAVAASRKVDVNEW